MKRKKKTTKRARKAARRNPAQQLSFADVERAAAKAVREEAKKAAARAKPLTFSELEKQAKRKAPARRRKKSAASAAKKESTTMAAKKRKGSKGKSKKAPARKKWTAKVTRASRKWATVRIRKNPLGLPPAALGAAKVVAGLAVGVGAAIGAAKALEKMPMNKYPTAAALGAGALVTAGVVGKFLSPAAAAVAAAPLVTTAVKVAMLDHDGFKDASHAAAQHLNPLVAGVHRLVPQLPPPAAPQAVAHVQGVQKVDAAAYERARRAGQIQRVVSGL